MDCKQCGKRNKVLSRRKFIRNLGYGICGSIIIPPILRHAWSSAAPVITGATPKAAVASGPDAAYVALHRSGELKRRAGDLWAMMKECRLCPRDCGARRLDGKSGFCRAPGKHLVISGHSPHFGEERPLVGKRGSGTIFFSHCNLRCVFCQNWEISHRGRGSGRSIDDLAGMMLDLQQRGCHNVNVVTPTHYLPHIIKALDIAAGRGLRIPVVYNTAGWEKPDIIKQLDGIVDIYLPDIKFGTSTPATRYSAGAASYPHLTQAAVLEMHRQVGVARAPADGIMRRGVMIRHLVMPNHVEDSIGILEWIAGNLPPDTYVNIMAQYNPQYKAFDYPEIARRVTDEEYRTVVRKAGDLGLTNLDSRAARWL